MPEPIKPQEMPRLYFEELLKPYPDKIWLNITHKILRFFYPPYEVDLVDVKYVVSEPRLSLFNVSVLVTFALLAAALYYVTYKHYFEKVPKAASIVESETSLSQECSSDYQLGVRPRKEDQLPHVPATGKQQNNRSRSSSRKRKSALGTRTLWMPPEDVTPTSEELDKQDSASSIAIKKSSVKFNKQVKCRLIEGECKVDVDMEEKDEPPINQRLVKTVKTKQNDVSPVLRLR